ncbi:hypothetical protein Afil01_66180 [Actinorhabdospora filicis]|uniref:WXG100 family type VII secretion target n=1 Tax=Actinorhabdospora filicis TaxID=1785913 RepID=A0A9W6SSS5_9ACTN|nr:hypothetical protein [Actinorhabdospora filicis]GLZ81811.1 hypothetical protein Afil01_66180 [Actinorhabdospora filicis]
MSDLDAYLPPYQSQDHAALWKSLQAGDPGQIDGLAATWVNPIRATLDDFVLDLDRDLTDLMDYWSEKTEGGAEFKRRLSLVIQFADQLAGHVGTIKDNLHAWKTALETAQGNAPDPADTDDSGRTIAGAAIGTAILGPAGALIGGLIGHEQDEEQRREAREKIIMIIAELAREYDTKEEIKSPPPLPPVDLPDSVNHGNPGMKAIDGTVIPTASAFTPKAIATPDDGEPAPEKPGEPPVIGPPGGETDLLGVGDGTLTGVNVGTSGTLGFAAPGGSTFAASPLSGGAGLFPGAATLRGGRPSVTALESAKSPAAAKTEAAKAVPNAKAPARPPSARTAPDEESRDRVYETWLTEDDMVWGDAAEPAPATLGARFVPEPPEPPRAAVKEIEGPPENLA